VLLVEAIALGALDDLRSGTELLVADLELGFVGAPPLEATIT